MSEGRYCYDYPRPAVTVDAVVFVRREGREHLLLIRRGREPFMGRWALPGGFVDIDEPLAAAVVRELHEETRLKGRATAQVGAYGDPGRDPRGRVIGVAYLVAVDDDAEPAAGDDAAEARWWPLDALPAMAFDHDRIVADAVAQRARDG